jgi:hypothetical protein
MKEPSPEYAAKRMSYRRMQLFLSQLEERNRSEVLRPNV